MPNGGLVAVMDFTAVAEDEFHDWYDLEHLPERLRIPGFLGGERWLGATNPRYSIGTYDLSGIDVLRGAPYRAIAGVNASPWAKRVTGLCERIVRIEADQILPGDLAAPNGAGGLSLEAMNVAPEVEAEFNAWSDAEHAPSIAAVPGVLAVRRFRSREGSHRYFNLCHLATPEVTETRAWKLAAESVRAEKLRPHLRDHLRILGRKYRRANSA